MTSTGWNDEVGIEGWYPAFAGERKGEGVRGAEMRVVQRSTLAGMSGNA